MEVKFYKILSNFLFFYILLNGFLFSQQDISEELSGFRGTAWGSSMDKVKSVETAVYMQSFHGFGIDALSYKGNIAGLDARIDYSFKDGKLFEGTYSIYPGDSFKAEFNKLKKYLIDDYGRPIYRAGPSIDMDTVWIKVTDYGEFKGPELYWKFNNGFIGLIASKFDEDITITILYTNSKSIEEYGKNKQISTDTFNSSDH